MRRSSSRLHPAIAVMSLCALAGCHAGVSDDPGAERAAAAAGRTASALEALSVVASILDELPAGAPPDEAVAAANVALEAAFLGCAEITVLAGDTIGLWLSFPGNGCSIPLTGLDLRGAFSFETTSMEETSTWAVSFDRLVVLDVAVDGAVWVRIEEGRRVVYEIADLVVNTGEAEIRLDGEGVVVTDPLLSDVLFDGNGRVGLDGESFAFEVDDLSRKLRGDCYPESGRISVSVLSRFGLVVSAEVDFEDRGLDSDDSGLVRVTLLGEEHVARLPERACAR